MISRIVQKQIESQLSDRKVLIILGARQVGKTTLIKHLKLHPDETLFLNGDDLTVRKQLEDVGLEKWKLILGNKKYLVIDEAQRIENIGLKIKLITDQLDFKVILPGSSALELANNINEPLTGRKWETKLFPFAFEELVNANGYMKEQELINHRLIYGYYPEVVNNYGNEQNILNSLSDSYLYKDILSWQGIRKADKLKMLLQALAWQVGSEVSYNELGKTIGLDNQSVLNYVNLLEKNFIIFRLSPLSKNLRKELKSKQKIYFWDNGIRNAIIAQFNSIEFRQDRGQLWENWLIAERLKFNSYHRRLVNSYFWRTHDQQEIDYIESYNGEFHAYEIKWNEKRKTLFSKSFTNSYQPKTTKIISPQNVSDFLLNYTDRNQLSQGY